MLWVHAHQAGESQNSTLPGLLRRLCDPYITSTILKDTFGELAHEVASKYLQETEKGRFRLRDEYSRCLPWSMNSVV